MDLQNIFTSVINMTVTGSLVILCVLAARLVLKKAPRVLSWALWLVVLLRLLCPVSVSGPVSVLSLVDAPMAETGTAEFVELPVRAPLETIQAEPEQIGAGTVVETVIAPTEAPIDWNFLGSRVWVAVAAALLGYGIISYVNLKRKLRESVPLGRGVRESDAIAAPFVLGRTIYLPTGLREEERRYILLHEQLHLRHGDHILKPLFWLAVCIHWFNPLVWLAFFLCGRDMELRCDEAVLKKLGPRVRSDYAQSLLDLAMGRRFAPAPLAFGEGSTGKRVKFVLKWKKTRVWTAVFGAVFCAAVLLLTACDPAQAPAVSSGPFGHSYKATMVVTSTQHDAPVVQNQLFTLTSDMALFLRNNGKTAMEGSFKQLEDLPDTCAACVNQEEWERLKEGSVNAWECIQAGTDNYLLIEMMDGTLYLIQGDQRYQLERTDLLGVTIRQPGMESYIEPIWYASGSQPWTPEEKSVTPVDGSAKIILTPEPDVEKILVSEEYYERQPDGETTITVSDHFLEPGITGEFSLEVSRRGSAGDDYAVYRVTVGDDSYLFSLSFPAVPGETSISVGMVEEIREVRYFWNGAYIILPIPESWDYAITLPDAGELDAGVAGGISFWPRGREEGKVFFGHYPEPFGVCGTGLESTEMVLAGRKATVGTYDGRALWDFIGFSEDFAVWGQGHESWWNEYGETAMAVLDSAQFGVVDAIYRCTSRDSTDANKTISLSRANGKYVHLWVQNLDPELHCYIRINDGQRLLLNPGENGWVTAEVTWGEYEFYCSCDIANVSVNLCIIQNDSPTPIG